MATAEKQSRRTRKSSKPVTEPAWPADIAFGNTITSALDAADVKQAALQNDKDTREKFYDREMARLTADTHPLGDRDNRRGGRQRRTGRGAG